MAPKTRSQGVASPAPELPGAPPRTRARKPKSTLSTAATCPTTKPSTSLSPMASSPAPKPATPLTPNVSRPQQFAHSTSLTSAELAHTPLLCLRRVVEKPVKDKSPSPGLHDPRTVLAKSEWKNPYVQSSPSIFHVQTNYEDASVQTSVHEPKWSCLTVQPAQTPVKRGREESAGEVEDGRGAKRHQSNPAHGSSQTATSIRTSIPTLAQASTNTSTKMSTHAGLRAATGKQSLPSHPLTTSKRTTMASITQAKSRAKPPRSSPISHSQVDPLQINRNMTWGQMTRVHSRRAKLAASREQPIPSSQDEELVARQSPQSSQPAADPPPPPSPTTPQTAPQPRTGLFGSIRKTLDFVPQLPALVAKGIFSNPFAPTRPEPAVESQPPESQSHQEPMRGVEVDSFMKPAEQVSESRHPPQRIRDVVGRRGRKSSSTSKAMPVRDDTSGAKADVTAAPAKASPVTVDVDADRNETDMQHSSQKRKRQGYHLYFDEADYGGEEPSDSDSPDGESSAPDSKKQKLDDAQTPRSVLKKRTGASTLPRSSKHVTFDDSPLDTPSKLRTRSFEYTGTTFADAPGRSDTSLSSDDETSLFNSPGTKANTEANTPFYYEPPKYPPLPEDYVLPSDFTPTSANPRPGTFCLDFNTYDENDDDIDWEAPVEATQSDVAVGEPDAPTSIQTSATPLGDLASTSATEAPPATPRIAHAKLPATTATPAGINIHADVDASMVSPPNTVHANVLADVTQEQINKVRSTAEQHRSKNPSRLSQVERATSVSPPAEDGYNEFDAGWPKPKTYVEAGVCSQRIFDIVTKGWDPRDSVVGEMVYQQDLKEWIDAHRLEKEQGIPVNIHWGDEEAEP